MTIPASSASPQPRYVRVLSIAGSDSGGGAGIQADLKTFSALGCYGMTAITAITAQNTLGVTGIHGIPPDMLRAQIDAVAQDIGVDAVKVGMLATPEVVRVVAQAIRTHRLPHVVLDPVMVTTSGDRLIASETVQVLVNELFPLAAVVTPNLDEAALLLGREIDGIDALEDAVQELLGPGRTRCAAQGRASERRARGGPAGHADRPAQAPGKRPHRHAQRPRHGLHIVVGHCRVLGAGLRNAAGRGKSPRLHPGGYSPLAPMCTPARAPGR